MATMQAEVIGRHSRETDPSDCPTAGPVDKGIRVVIVTTFHMATQWRHEDVK